MSEQTQNLVTPEELEKRKAAIQDAYEFSAYIPDDLRLRLETLLTDPAARTAVLELQILAIKYGRAIQKRDLNIVTESLSIEFHAKKDQGKRPSDLALKLVDRIDQTIHKVNDDKKVDILVAPGFLDVTKKH